MTEVSAVLLDLDNTVYPYMPCHEAGLRAAFERAAEGPSRWRSEQRFLNDYQRARDAVKDQLGVCAASHSRLLYFKTMVDQVPDDMWIDVALRLCDAYWRGYFGEMIPDPDCRRVLDEWRDSGIKLAWVTNFNTRRQLLKLAALGLADAVHVLVSSEEAGVEKPDPAILDLALHRLGLNGDGVWLVGDDLAQDGAAARARGVDFVWFRRWCTAGVEAAPGQDMEHQVSSWAELGEVLS